MFDYPLRIPALRYWARHMAAVPKGFLRYHVLELLNEKPLSGSEIINEIGRVTGGCWKPSPGSVYPLLAWLQDNGYIEEVPAQESGIKRYTLTAKGKSLLEEQRKIRSHFRMEKMTVVPPFYGLWLHIPPEYAEKINETFRRFFRAIFNLRMSLEEKFSESAMKEALDVLNDTAQKLEEIERRLREAAQS
ncbi:MAG: PadR family transcriptional regulator [Nitrososphaerota archaeon]|nr:PadR family transcriptional regulator [Aigarchaeota archaeon]MDW8077005.1 PadR family transcriptional regulator [Nitrososphaerota archaeon]